MPRTDAELLRDLGRGTSIASIRAGQAWSEAEFDAWWRGQLVARQSPLDGRVPASTTADVTILRDDRGVPHCSADSDEDLFVAYGFAMAIDRLFQLDVRRRKGNGRLAALIGPAGIADDRVAHTMGLAQLAAAELERLDAETRSLLEHFAAGVSAAVASMGPNLPIEYALLGAEWEPWSALDSIACTVAWRWQFTGRPHAYAGPELLRRVLGDDRLFGAILAADREADTPTLPPDAIYPAVPDIDDLESGPGAATAGMAGDTPGSNDWVMSGRWSRSGSPLLASDPHMPYESFSAFYEVGLHGRTFDAVGAGLVGMPGLVMGRNRTTAFGFTNNACSLRDMYQERAVGSDGSAFEYDDRTVKAERHTVSIEVRDAEPVTLEVSRTERGPIIDAILPGPTRGTGPVSMRWLGEEPCTWPAALLGLTRATSVRDAFVAVRGWLVPSFGLVIADVEGAIGFIFTGRIPLRSRSSRSYRRGWDAADRWVGLIPDEAMPQAIDPARGWLASANNRPAPDDYPYPQSGTWAEGYRVRRVGRLIEDLEPGSADRATLTAMHQDIFVHRTEDILDAMLSLLGPGSDERQERALELLRSWDRRADAHSAAAAIYEVTFHRWAQSVMSERIADRETADYLANWGLGFAAGLLLADEVGWFAPGRREALIATVFSEALDEIERALGPDLGSWRWGALRRLRLQHPLSGNGDLGQLLDKPVGEVSGDIATLSNSGFEGTRPFGDGPDGTHAWRPSNGAGYRLEIDLGEDPPAAWSITFESQSGVPGSAHYGDQIDDFLGGRTRRLSLDPREVEESAIHRQILTPAGSGRESEQGETST